MKKVFTFLSAVSIAIFILVRRVTGRARKALKPRYLHFTPPDFEPELFEFETEDGLTLRGKRYPNRGGTPVILMHGFSGNGFDFDLAIEECNMALYLARRGYDVWISNFRGAGRSPYKSDGGDFRHSIEDLAVYDVPALIDGITSETGMKPVWIGHSMGAVTAYGHLQGIRFVEEGGTRRVKPHPQLARERNEKLAALVSLAGPTCFRWPAESRFFWLAGNPLVRPILLLIRESLKVLARVVRRIPVEQVAVWLVSGTPRLGIMVIRGSLSLFVNMKNVTDETFKETLLCGGSDVSMTQAIQLVDALVRKDFTESSAVVGKLEGEPYNFTRGAGLITAPVLFITGDRDPVNHKTVHCTGYEQVSSEVKDFRCFPDYSHVDLLVGSEANRTVYPYVADWLQSVLG